MASMAVYDAVLARLEANWNSATRGPISDANGGGNVPADLGPFLTLEFPVARSEQISVGAPGANLFREEGAFRLILSVKMGEGRKPYDQWIQDLRALFRNHVAAGLTTWEPSPPSHDGQSEVNEAYYEMSVAVPFQFDFYA